MKSKKPLWSSIPVLILVTVFTTLYPARVSGKKFDIPKSHCPTTCGNFSIPYPFGIGKDCSRQGLDLICDNSTSPPKLLLGNSSIEVSSPIDIQHPYIGVVSKVIAISAAMRSYTSTLMNLNNRPYRLFSVASEGNTIMQSSNNFLYMVGCSATAYLKDIDENITVGSCTTICPNSSHPEDGYSTPCNVTGDCCRCCTISNLPSNLTFSGLEVTRGNLNAVKNTTIYAFISNRHYTAYSELSGMSERSRFEAMLSWYIDDKPSCEEALKHNESYACRSSNSYCYNVYPLLESQSAATLGYVCRCPDGQSGNPYIPNGCQGLPINSLIPKSNCTRKCGNVDVPFPYGLEEGCYRDQTFALTCNSTLNGPTLYYRTSLVVTNISLEEGQLATTLTTTSGSGGNFLYFKQPGAVSWVVEYQSCNSAIQNRSAYACLSNQSICEDVEITDDYHRHHPVYRCKCQNGYQGNPYLLNGCTDIDECQHPESYTCYGKCLNTEGNYSCTCWPGTYGDPTHGPCLPEKGQNILFGLVIGLSLGVALLIVSGVLFVVKHKWKKRNQKMIREKFFSQNHGLLLEQLISASEDTTERTKIFSLQELERATNNFDSSRIVGDGGHGTVYKGILSDQRVVAIKKSKIVKKREIKQFINEVAILSQVNHRNVVKLFGCCLETEVPLLVYQFITNGTLYDHLHSSNHGSVLSWDDRLRIATETAGALAYLHSAASISIFHRDIKSSNILLDEYFTAKISDFGSSRSIPLDQTHIVTGVQGTYGYLDPEYYQTGQLTEKSDVYSFGVILLELLTRRKPICSGHDEDIHLPMQFLQAIRENWLFELIDVHIRTEMTREELLVVTKLAESCLKLHQSKRPTMKEVEITLRSLRKKSSENGKINEEHNEETEYLLSQSLVELHAQHTGYKEIFKGTRNYSLEQEMISSIEYPR